MKYNKKGRKKKEYPIAICKIRRKTEGKKNWKKSWYVHRKRKRNMLEALNKNSNE